MFNTNDSYLKFLNDKVAEGFIPLFSQNTTRSGGNEAKAAGVALNVPIKAKILGKECFVNQEDKKISSRLVFSFVKGKTTMRGAVGMPETLKDSMPDSINVSLKEFVPEGGTDVVAYWRAEV